MFQMAHIQVLQTCIACMQHGQQHPWQLSGLWILKTSSPLIGTTTGILNSLEKSSRTCLTTTVQVIYRVTQHLVPNLPLTLM